ncbi:MAG: N-acylneuraminate cytidylyltransferase [Parcubacteria group bacterium Licking1014_17]|nr:MAG: N-acylneuraminate cytidylyltransferase [Parcubacteria group bacterium Licking1014_17]
MVKNKKVLAIIPARSGSKGIKDKNIKSFCGKPLIYYTISEALKSRHIDRLIVSTDSEEYAKIARRFNAEVPFLRPKELATDSSPIVDTILHLIEKLKRDENYIPDYILLLQTTSPLRTSRDIDNCINILNSGDCDGVVSMCSTEQLLYGIKDGFIDILFNKNWIRKTNRQSLQATYRLNGSAIYLISREVFIKTRSFLKARIRPYIMDRWQSLDLDDINDFINAEIIYRNRNKFHNKWLRMLKKS